MADGAASLRARIGGILLSGALASLVLLLALAFLAPLVFGESAARIDPSHALRSPAAAHPLGTDELGRDVLLRVLVAGRLSLGISLAATLVGAAAGILLGALPTVAGRTAGRLIGAGIDLALAFPALLLALFVAAVLGAGAQSAVIAIALAMAPVFARLTYTTAASVRHADHVAAARLLGVGRTRLLTRHIIPAVAEPLLVTAVIGVSGALLVLSGLSFLGLGIQAPSYDWGVLLSQGLNRIYVSPASALAPAAAIVITGMMLALIGEALALMTGIRTLRSAPGPRPASEAISDLPPPAGPVLSVQDLTIAFGKEPVVKGVSFEILPGERVGLVGESGSGKTVSALAAAGLPVDGAAVQARGLHFLGRRLGRGMPDDELRHFLGTRMAFVFQDPLGSFNPLMRIGNQLAEVAEEHRGTPRREALATAANRLGEVGLDDPARSAAAYPYQLSGGMLQRSMIAMGLMAEPRLMIADEPTTALDMTVQKRVLDLLDQVCETSGTALLLITHDLAIVAERCERVIVMYGGRVVEELTVEALLHGPAHPYTRALCAAVIPMDADKHLPLPTIPAAPPQAVEQGCAFRPGCSRANARCAEGRPDLAELAPRHRVACWNPSALPAGSEAS